jgi:MoaA/NifB/PqqE/SkfB family radical SAM enzyme
MKIKRLDLKITFKCTNNCLFCAQGAKRYQFVDKDKKEVFRELKKNFLSGIRGVVFTGGEPTLHKNITDFIRYAKKIGYKVIQLQTNAQNLSDIKLLKKLKKNGLNEVAPSIHAFDPDLHNKLVRNPNAFYKTFKGIYNSISLGLNTVTNTVITKQNYKELPKIAKMLVKLKANQIQFAFVHLVGTAYKNRFKITPRKTDILPYLIKAINICKANNIPVFTEAIPYCILRGYEECVVESNIPETTIVDSNFKIKNYSKYRLNYGKVKSKKCLKCLFYKKCEGPWKEYPELYGWKEFMPIK